jgi:hypothetical protein
MIIADWSRYYLGSRKLDPVSMRLFNKVRWEFIGKFKGMVVLDMFCEPVDVGGYN